MQRRWSPYETLELDSEEGETPFASIHHCLWFSIASWVQQGCDFLPRYGHKHVPKNSQETENLARIHECNFKLEILSTFCVNHHFQFFLFLFAPFKGPYHRGPWPVFGGFSHSS